MNIYYPYHVLSDTAETLHLQQSKPAESAYFLKARALPLALILLTWLVLQQAGAQIPMAWNYTLMLVVLLIAVMLLIRKNISEIKIGTGTAIQLTHKVITGTKQVTVRQAEIDSIILIHAKSVHGGATFILKTKSKMLYPFLHIVPQNGQTGTVNIVKQNLEKMLGVSIKELQRGAS